MCSMKKSELLEKLKLFKEKLEAHKELYEKSFYHDEHLGRFNAHPSENIEELENQRKELNRLYAILEKYIAKYSIRRIREQPLTGMRWDIYPESIGNSSAQIKSDSLNHAIMDLEGVIAKVETEAKEEIDIIESKDINEEIEERDKKIKIFLSYSNMDKDLSGQVKFELEDYALQVFLAHEDIEPSAEWVDTILDELKACDVFIPILTKNFEESDWTDQETGIAIAYNKLIIPIKLSVDPHGFISRYQALKIDINNIKTSCHELIKVISSHPKLRSLFRNALIKKFGDSNNFENASHNTKILLSIEDFTIHQVNDIINHTINNIQINRCYKARDKLRNLIYNYKDGIDARLIEAFYEAIKPGL